MPFIMRFILAALTTGVAVSGVSLVWPKFTSKPAPDPLVQVRDVVLQTSIGKQAAEVLGVSDGTQTAPVDIGSAAGSIVNTVMQDMEKKVQDAATKEIIIQVINKIETLDPGQKEEVKKAICK